MTSLVVAVVAVALLVAAIAVLRRRSGGRVEVSTPAVLDESPLTALDRLEATARGIRGYAVERRGLELVVYRRHEGPLAYFESPGAVGAEAYLDLLHVTAERRDDKTWIWLKGRSEPRVIERLRRAM